MQLHTCCRHGFGSPRARLKPVVKEAESLAHFLQSIQDAAEINFTQALQAFEDFENWVRTKEALSHTKERNEESHLS